MGSEAHNAQVADKFKSGDRVIHIDGDEDDQGVVRRVSKAGDRILVEFWEQGPYEESPKLRSRWRWTIGFRVKAVRS